MSLEIEKVSYDPAKTDMSGIRFTQSKTGHVHSPWFTYDYSADLKDGKPFYGFGFGKLSEIMGQSKRAFSAALGMQGVDGIIATEKPPTDKLPEFQWRLGTCGPWYLPKPSLPEPSPLQRLPERDDRVIDVEAAVVKPKKRKRLK